MEALGHAFLVPPPPSSAAAIVAALRVVSLAPPGPLYDTGLGTHRVVESLKHGFAIRLNMGDSGPAHGGAFDSDAAILNDVQDDDYVQGLWSMIQNDTTLEVHDYGGVWNLTRAGELVVDHGTSHFNVVDRDRRAVTMTTTINTSFGSKVVSPSTGIIFNNQMDDFSTPGRPNTYGLAPEVVNFIQPGKRPFSSMSPMVVEQGRDLRLVIGARGGPRIIPGVMHVLLQILNDRMDAEKAVRNPRLFHQLVPDVVYAESWNSSACEFAYDASILKVAPA
ncbi:gamma-glutamyltranspeptidase [Helicosporidium sp. ATCC 50920]|nr:gamma-glutamyltranspeptidase [Helicosporidium sp. ATCC 50920]|eukprot:KDD72044.1 gamma-glutamyltranspeptidase [Helicosporidium sp. ATCC 50920]